VSEGGYVLKGTLYRVRRGKAIAFVSQPVVTQAAFRRPAKVAKMLAKHLEGLLNFTLYPITNAVSEGFNSKIQSLKADARGFRNVLNYRTRILFYCGRLDLFPSTHEIP
jgi:hypothetical protein